MNEIAAKTTKLKHIIISTRDIIITNQQNKMTKTETLSIQILCKKLPTEICNTILEYHGYYKCRNGKYISQLDVSSPKYKALYEIPRIEPIPSGDYINSVNGLIQYTTLHGGCECTFMRTTEETDTTPKKVTRYTFSNYVYDDVTRWMMNVREVEYNKPNHTTSRILQKGRIVWTQKYHIETVRSTNPANSMIPSIEFIM